jgi:hypothetical protein
VSEAGIRDYLRDALLGAGQTHAVEACEREDIDMILLSQHLFGHSMQDILTLGTLVKYAGANGKRVVVVVQEIKADEEPPEPEEL